MALRVSLLASLFSYRGITHPGASFLAKCAHWIYSVLEVVSQQAVLVGAEDQRVDHVAEFTGKRRHQTRREGHASCLSGMRPLRCALCFILVAGKNHGVLGMPADYVKGLD